MTKRVPFYAIDKPKGGWIIQARRVLEKRVLTSIKVSTGMDEILGLHSFDRPLPWH
jgi:hypothetical protein